MSCFLFSFSRFPVWQKRHLHSSLSLTCKLIMNRFVFAKNKNTKLTFLSWSTIWKPTSYSPLPIRPRFPFTKDKFSIDRRMRCLHIIFQRHRWLTRVNYYKNNTQRYRPNPSIDHALFSLISTMNRVGNLRNKWKSYQNCHVSCCIVMCRLSRQSPRG